MSSLFSVAAATVGGGHQARSGGYKMQRSVRLRSAASAYFSRTPASATNRKTWTWSGWVKRGTIGASLTIMGAQANGSQGTQRFNMFFAADNTLIVNDSIINVSDSLYLITTQVFRDPSAWYHIVVAIDTTQATASNRAKLYINGTQVTALSTATYPSQNFDTAINNNVPQYIAYYNNLGSIFYYDGYLTEINFIDGQALTPSDFGQTDPYTGVWSARRYAGTYGTNGFYLNFSDNSAATAAAIGKDYSGNGNNWTPNNISVTAGVTYDSMLDVPTRWADGGNGRGNYCVINPLAAGADATISNANLSVAYGTSATISTTLGTMGMSSGQWYWENTITATSLAAVTAYIGMVNQSNPTGAGAYPGATSRGWSYYGNLGNIYNNGGTIQTSVGTFAVNDVIGVAYDADAGTLRFFKNNTQVGTTITGIPADTYYPAWSDGSVTNTFTIAANFGQRPLSYTPPSGFKTLNTQNLP